MLTLSNLQINKKAKQKKRRLGRGDASGRGNYSGKGMKGQGARSGVSGLKRLGMKKVIAQIPKHRGFKRMKSALNIVNLNSLQNNFQSGQEVNVKKMFQAKIIDSPKNEVKILGKGNLDKKLTVKAHYFSKSAKQAIIKAGGKIIETPRIRKTAQKNKKRAK